MKFQAEDLRSTVSLLNLLVMRHQATGQVRPIWALMCLLAYLLSTTPLLPIATTLVAWADGDHRVLLSADKDGTRVVLGHDARDIRTALTHSHCGVSLVLTLLAQPSGPVHSDHVLNFQSGSCATPREATPCIPVPPTDETPTAPAMVSALVLPRLVSNAEGPPLDTPPAAISVTVVRTTVLLI